MVNKLNLLNYFQSLSDMSLIVAILFLAIVSHVLVHAIRKLTQKIMATRLHASLSKARTITSLISSLLIFIIYFGAIGIALNEIGVPIGTYLASASIIGLAIAFGSQGLVQDVVSGITFIFSDLVDVGDMVEIGGQVGIVTRLGMRFTVLKNAFGAEVFIPNRSITNVISYPRGYIRCIADITLSKEIDKSEIMEKSIRFIVDSTFEQFPGILLTPPDYEGIQQTSIGRKFLRVKFRIWPGRGGPIENNFKQEIIQALKQIDDKYEDWMVAINYEVEKKESINVNWKLKT